MSRLLMDARRILACLLLAGFDAALIAGDASTAVPFAQLPPAVQKGIQAQAGKGTIGEISRDEVGGEVSFIVEITKDGRARDYTVDEAGALVSVEVVLAEIPPAAQVAIRAQVGPGTVETIEKTLDDQQIVYDVDWKARDGSDQTFTVLESGRLKSIQVPLQATPLAVQAAITKEAAQATIIDITKNFDDEGVSYDVSINRGGHDRDFSVAESGNLLSREVFWEEVPGPAKKTIGQRTGGGKITRIDEVLEKVDNVFPFEVEVVKDGKSFSFDVGPKGKFLGLNQ